MAPAPATPPALRGRHFLEVDDLAPGELSALVGLAAVLKQGPVREQAGLLRGRTVALLFEKPSLRTRVSFEVAMTQLGAQPLFANGAISHRQPRDAGRRGARALALRRCDRDPHARSRAARAFRRMPRPFR